MTKKFIIIIYIFFTSFNAFAFKDYGDGARWAFVSDRISNKIAIIDTFERQFIEHKELQTIPEQIIVSDIKDILLYHDKKNTVIYAVDLNKGLEWEIPLNFTPYEIILYPDGSKIAVVGDKQISIIDPFQKIEIEKIENINNPVSVNFSSDGYKLFITEKNTGNTLIWSVYHKFSRKIKMGEGATVSDISLSPNSLLALVSSKNSLFIYNRVEKKLYSPIILDGKLSRPYISTDSKNIILASNNGKGFILKSWAPNSTQAIPIGSPPNIIRTGWLETVGIISAKDQINIFPLNGKGKHSIISTHGNVEDMVVTSDSKSLFATQGNSSKIKVINLRHQETLNDIDTALNKPYQIVMGRTNTVCN